MTAPALREDLVYTVPECAAIMRLGSRTLYAAIRRGEFPPAVRIGRRVVVPGAGLVAWLTAGRGRDTDGRPGSAVGVARPDVGGTA